MSPQSRPQFEGVLQGPIGSEMRRLGIDPTKVNAHAAVMDIMRHYRDAGAHIGVANTFGITPHRIANVAEPSPDIQPRAPFLPDLVSANQEAVDQARLVYGDRWVAASVGPLSCTSGGSDSFWRSLPSEEHRIRWAAERHRPQIKALLEADPDLILGEALRYNAEAIAIARVVQELGGRMAAICFEANRQGLPSPINGDARSFRELKGRLKEEAPDVDIRIGANCTGSSIIQSLLAEDELDIAYVNSLDFGGDQRWYREFVELERKSNRTPQEEERWAGLKHALTTTDRQYETFAGTALNSGVSVIGGCCGTTPDTVRIFRATWDNSQRKPVEPGDDLGMMREAL